MCIFQLGDWLRGKEGPRWRESDTVLRRIGKMAERTFADRVLLPVAAAIYRNGEEKPAIRWSFEMGIGVESDKKLFDFMFRIREGLGIADRCSQLKIARFKVTISMKDFQVTANCPEGRVFEIDSQEQWDAAIAKVIRKERQLIGRLAKSGLYLNILNARSMKLFIHDHSFITFVLSDNSNLQFFFIRICTKWSFP